MKYRHNYSVNLKTVVEELKFSPVYLSQDYENVLLRISDINRPGLQLAGFYDYFEPGLIQICGKVETTYLKSLDPDTRARSLETLLYMHPAALVFSNGQEPVEELLELAEEYDVSVFKTEVETSETVSNLLALLKGYLAPRETLHGVLMEVFGEGVLIMGESGIGKSETALELIKRGHRLIADDAVEIKRMSRTALVGTAPELIRYYMELRGIGVVDIRYNYGVGAVKQAEKVELVVKLEMWDQSKVYDRLGIDTDYINILGVEIPCVTIPVKPGRNLAVILEMAAVNNRQKKMGHNSAKKFVDNINAAASGLR
jgi:HPr kinase/phosphorylase